MLPREATVALFLVPAAGSGREGLDQQIVERFPRLESASKVDGAGRQGLVTEGFKSGLLGVDGAHQALEFPESLAFARL